MEFGADNKAELGELQLQYFEKVKDKIVQVRAVCWVFSGRVGCSADGGMGPTVLG